MTSDTDSDTGTEQFVVVTNAEEQYSIWQQGLAMPPGWKATGFSGSRAQCLDHVDEVWTDMRPLSARSG